MFSREDRENGQIGNIADGDKDLVTKNAFNKCLSRPGLPGRSVVTNVPAVQETQVRSLVRKIPQKDVPAPTSMRPSKCSQRVRMAAVVSLHVSGFA